MFEKKIHYWDLDIILDKTDSLALKRGVDGPAGFEPDSIEVFTREVKEGDVVVDIGAHIGVYTLLAAKNGAKVHAFEPNDYMRNILKKNVKKNGFTDLVTIYDYALSNEAGIGTLHLSNGGDDRIYEYARPTSNTQKIRIAKLDHILGEADFIKMDVQGVELEVLKGAEELLKNSPKIKMLVESQEHVLKDAGHSEKELEDYLHSLDFFTVRVNENLYCYR